ncbi:hypothetical protein HDU93_009889 [Gonapodya sp. JEL0774]|nr:hypothetical protein HDU93_009889 [Gonapodya sp. JEL0774]
MLHTPTSSTVDYGADNPDGEKRLKLAFPQDGRQGLTRIQIFQGSTPLPIPPVTVTVRRRNRVIHRTVIYGTEPEGGIDEVGDEGGDDAGHGDEDGGWAEWVGWLLGYSRRDREGEAHGDGHEAGRKRVLRGVEGAGTSTGTSDLRVPAPFPDAGHPHAGLGGAVGGGDDPIPPAHPHRSRDQAAHHPAYFPHPPVSPYHNTHASYPSGGIHAPLASHPDAFSATFTLRRSMAQVMWDGVRAGLEMAGGRGVVGVLGDG